MTKTVFAIVVAATTIAASIPLRAETSNETVLRAHDAYLAAINSNDTEMFLNTVTDDIVFIAPDSPVMVGKAEVGPWVDEYFSAVKTTWQKTTLEFVVNDDWAFERYAYTSIDRPREGGNVHRDTGNGINIYRLDGNGVWRVARDVWATNGSHQVSELTCTLADMSQAPC